LKKVLLIPIRFCVKKTGKPSSINIARATIKKIGEKIKSSISAKSLLSIKVRYINTAKLMKLCQAMKHILTIFIFYVCNRTFSQSKRHIVSFEILPPLKGKTITSIYDHLDPLMEFKPSWINVTYHRNETMFKKKTDGTFEKVDVRKRPGTGGGVFVLLL
jgi:hypothetical protein